MAKTANKQKGSTLVEVLVALSVFLIVMGTLVAGYLSAKRVVLKQKEFVYFEVICEDIDTYGDLYGKQWDEKYFGADVVHKFGENGYEITSSDGGSTDGENTENSTSDTSTATAVASYAVYYNAKFEPVAAKDDARYELTYRYNTDESGTKGNLIINIKNIVSDYPIIENLDYGNSRYN